MYIYTYKYIYIYICRKVCTLRNSVQCNKRFAFTIMRYGNDLRIILDRRCFDYFKLFE